MHQIPVAANPSPTAMTASPTTMQESASSSSSISPSMMTQELTVAGNEFSFSPSSITVKKGQTIKITFKNVGKYPHNFTISDLNLHTKTLQPGETDSIEFTADKVGTFEYMCTVDSHAEKGMKGTLIVQ